MGQNHNTHQLNTLTPHPQPGGQRSQVTAPGPKTSKQNLSEDDDGWEEGEQRIERASE